MSAIDSVKNYFQQVMAPKIQEFTSLDELIVVIGGSVSYGFADELSDVDAYIIWDIPRNVWFDKLRQFLFMHQMIDGYRVQFIPLMLQSPQYSSFSYLFHEEFDKLKDCDFELLYDIQHFIPIHDPKGIISKGKAFVSDLGSEYWQEKCLEHCEKLIDTLEAFYSSLKRKNIITGSMYFGDALKGLLQTVYLSAGFPYPTAKWIWNGLERVDAKMFESIRTYFENGFPCSSEELRNCIHSVTEVVTDRLKEKGFVPPYIINDLLCP
ncbi:hypothetical protein V6C42_00205 [Pseudoclostridium thermosuccinogenes]|uniref:hypothetical protein n=1 Tax=Clostridium thermosuccinogenes TaxID=84032 RepID=UPI002FD9EBEC